MSFIATWQTVPEYYDEMDEAIKRAVDFAMSWEQEYTSPVQPGSEEYIPILCSACFSDQGLRLVAQQVGLSMQGDCPHCGSGTGLKLSLTATKVLMQRFFNAGTMHRVDYGGAPLLVCNSRQPNNIGLAPWSGNDLNLLSEKTGWGVFEYGPRLWMLGSIDPLKALLDPATRTTVVDRILTEYPVQAVGPEYTFYRVRLNTKQPSAESEFDSPPIGKCGGGRLDSTNLSILYGSQDLQVCVHECRTTVDDDAYVATLRPTRRLRLLDLSKILREEKAVSEFESLDLAVHMLFLAKSHSYEISRELALAAKHQGFDGIIYPSYFSLLRTGARPFDTVVGMSVRHIEELEHYAVQQIVPNLAIFDWPVKDGTLKVVSINRLILEQAEYGLNLGPVGLSSLWPDGDKDPRSRTSQRAAMFLEADEQKT